MIRLAKKEDVATMLEIYAPFVRESAATFEKDVPSLQEFEIRVQKILKEAPWLVYESNNNVAGFAYSGNHREREGYRWTRETSIYIRPAFQRKNIGSALYTVLIEILRLQGYTTLLAGITLPNKPSERFHEKLGFLKVGVYHRVGYKLQKFHDAAWWELHINTTAKDRILHWNEIPDEEWRAVVENGEKLISI
jgi:L-amino acid N-acyltransferase YncA